MHFVKWATFYPVLPRRSPKNKTEKVQSKTARQVCDCTKDERSLVGGFLFLSERSFNFLITKPIFGEIWYFGLFCFENVTLKSQRCCQLLYFFQSWTDFDYLFKLPLPSSQNKSLTHSRSWRRRPGKNDAFEMSWLCLIRIPKVILEVNRTEKYQIRARLEPKYVGFVHQDLRVNNNDWKITHIINCMSCGVKDFLFKEDSIR